MRVTPEGIVRACREVQPLKAPDSMAVSVAGRLSSSSAVQPENMDAPSTRMSFGRVTDFSAVQSLKMCWSSRSMRPPS